MRNKGVFFVKKEKKGMPAENFDFAEHMAVGDVYPNVLDYLCLWVEEVLVPIFNNPENMKKFPKCIALGILMTSIKIFAFFRGGFERK